MLSITKAIPEYSRHSIENCCYRAVYMGWLFDCREVLNHLLLHRRKMSFQHSQNIWMRVHCSRVHSWLMYQGRPLMRNISRNRYKFQLRSLKFSGKVLLSVDQAFNIDVIGRFWIWINPVYTMNVGFIAKNGLKNDLRFLVWTQAQNIFLWNRRSYSPCYIRCIVWLTIRSSGVSAPGLIPGRHHCFKYRQHSGLWLLRTL